MITYNDFKPFIKEEAINAIGGLAGTATPVNAVGTGKEVSVDQPVIKNKRPKIVRRKT